ncbi:MAG: shikimate kinase, partial [Flavobacteriales bacterium]|nr:shikimate kinase [Flavobacteriales bacterium]
MRVFLIGFMCSGKSTVGRHLAPLLGLPFIDLDRVVEARVGPLLPYIVAHGEEAFRRHEAAVLGELAEGAPAVIA